MLEQTLVALGTVAALIAGLAPAAIPAAAAAAPQQLPADRLQFGLSNFDAGWIKSSGIPFRYRYQYLAGGVNTGNGWATWNSPPGRFATYYLQATPSATIPVFTYYQLLQSSPSAGGNEADRDYSNLNNPSTMSAYFADFKLLMQTAGAWGGQAVVHVEPDLWGYLQQRAQGGPASSVSASVRGSGAADVGSYPDNVQGFAQALLHLRDLYAPKLVMAYHASPWSSMIDIASDSDPALNFAAEADKTAAFMASTGAWDVVFNDVDDHDAGWWEEQGNLRWWDPTNQRFPNFTRYLAWVSELRARTGLQQVVWQVPLGNQYFLTMNNTCGHYQDNLAEYFFAHPQDLAAAGLVAVLFGSGNACQTSNEDGQKDGVTNNGGQATVDPAEPCGCNSHPSQYPDDDGGYLRMMAGRYYATPPPPPPTFPGGLFTATAPTRILDTRIGLGHSGAVVEGQTVDFQVAGVGGVPLTATSVTMNVTVTGATTAGAGSFVTVWPSGTSQPLASNLNFTDGKPAANLVSVALAGGRVSLSNHAGSTDLVADVAGYTTSGSGGGYNPLTPSRLVDTRAPAQTLGPGGTLTLGSMPAGASAVVLNVTAVNPSAPGYVTAWPAGQTRPTASNLNFVIGQTVPNRVVVQTGAGGISFYSFAGSTDLVVDLDGYFSTAASAAFTPTPPTRLLDTRNGSQPGPDSTLSLLLAGTVPLSATAVVLNLTAVGSTAGGYLTVWPAAAGRPLASDLNFGPGDIVPNLVIVKVGSGGGLNIYNFAGSVDVVADLLGWYS